jgi:hypothetical protein
MKGAVVKILSRVLSLALACFLLASCVTITKRSRCGEGQVDELGRLTIPCERSK